MLAPQGQGAGARVIDKMWHMGASPPPWAAGLRAVILDKDGTFVDFARTWIPTLHATLEALAAGDAGALARLAALARYDLHTGKLDPASPFLAEASADFAPDWAQAVGRAQDAHFLPELDALMARFSLQYLAPLGQPAAVFGALKRAGLKIGVLTNDAQAPAQAQIAALGLGALVDEVIGYDSGFGRKPSPQPLREIVRRFGLPAHAVAMVGDSAHDMACARGRGLCNRGRRCG